MDEDRLGTLKKAVSNLIVLLYTEYSTMVTYTQGEIIDPSLSDLSGVLKLSTREALDYIKKVIHNLVEVKKSIIGTELYESMNSHESYQKALQKLDSEVRNHIKIEQQFKLYIENLQAKQEENQKILQQIEETNHQLILEITSENEAMREMIELHDRELNEIRRNPQSKPESEKIQWSLDVNNLKKTSRRDAQKLLELEKKSYKLEQEWNKLKGAYTEKAKECERHRQDFEMLQTTMRETQNSQESESRAATDYYKRKLEEKCREASRLESRLNKISQHDYRLTHRNQSKQSLPRKESRSKSPATSLFTKTLDKFDFFRTIGSNASKEKSSSNEALRKVLRKVNSSKRVRMPLSFVHKK